MLFENVRTAKINVLNNFENMTWRWSLNPSGEFSVSTLRAIIDSKLLEQTGSKLNFIGIILFPVKSLFWNGGFEIIGCQREPILIKEE